MAVRTLGDFAAALGGGLRTGLDSYLAVDEYNTAQKQKEEARRLGIFDRLMKVHTDAANRMNEDYYNEADLKLKIANRMDNVFEGARKAMESGDKAPSTMEGLVAGNVHSGKISIEEGLKYIAEIQKAKAEWKSKSTAAKSAFTRPQAESTAKDIIGSRQQGTYGNWLAKPGSAEAMTADKNAFYTSPSPELAKFNTFASDSSRSHIVDSLMGIPANGGQPQPSQPQGATDLDALEKQLQELLAREMNVR
jgi:hypothetical protein